MHENLDTGDLLRTAFAELQILELDAYEVDLREGRAARRSVRAHRHGRAPALGNALTGAPPWRVTRTAMKSRP